jgi:AcrR family transcriptional regulator
MESGNSDMLNDRRKALKTKYLARLQPIAQHQSISGLRIDDIARIMGVSKATFYKYFSSKEDVIEQATDLIVDAFAQTETLFGDDSSSLLLGFQNAFTQSLFLTSYLPDTFLLDLKQNYPRSWEHVKQAQQKRQQQLEQFYARGVMQGIFNPIKPVLFALQHELLLRNLMNPVFLLEHDLTLKTLLYDYYDLQKYQCLRPSMLQQIDDKPVKDFIDHMARKISLGIQSDVELISITRRT